MDCSENQYYDKGGCHSCAQCPPGQELSEDCGYGYGALARCRPCDARWFKEAWGSHACQMCQACRHVNRRELSPCTPTRNAVCGECLPGFYSKRRLDGQQDLECMPCGHPPFRDPLCGKSREVDVENVWSLEAASQSATAVTASICGAVVAMAILLSFILFMYRRYTSLRKFFKGCLIPHSRSHSDTEASSVSMKTQCTLTQEEEGQVAGVMPRQTTSDKGSDNSEGDCRFPATPSVTSDPMGRVPCPLRQSICSDCSSGFASQPSSGLPTPLPTSCDLAAPAPATRGRHCASEEGSGWPQRRHAPVECTELDIHESFPTEAELHSSSAGPGPGPESGPLPEDGEPSLDLYCSAPPDISLEMRLSSEKGRTSVAEERRPADVHLMSDVFSLVQRSCAIMQDVPLRDLPVALVHSLAQRLDPVFPGVQSYQQVAQCLGVPVEITRGLQGFEHVFHYLSSCTLLTVPDLLMTLHRLHRLDALLLLCEHCTKTLSIQE